MRRYTSIIVLGLLVALGVSCSSEISIDCPRPAKSFLLNANYVGGYSTKTAIGEQTTTHSFAQIEWTAKDALSVFYDGGAQTLENASFLTNQEGLTAVFYPEDPALSITATEFLGLYPYNVEATASLSPRTISTVIPQHQTARDGSFDPSAQLAVGYSSSFSNNELSMGFYNVCSGLCFTLSSVDITRIVFYGNNQEVIAGPVSIAFDGNGLPVVSATGTTATSVELLPPPGAESFTAGAEYYLSFRNCKLPSGFTMVFYRGEASESHSCSSSVTFRRGAFGWVKNVDLDGKLENIRDGELLTYQGKSANCYIVSTPGTKKFPLVKGNDADAKLSTAASVEVLWETTNAGAPPTPGTIVSNVSINNGFVYLDAPNPIVNGNALIAAKDADGKILWSWHIWSCNGYDPFASAHLLYGKQRPMMDRNIGALSASFSPTDAMCNGFFYQWGRKDPFPGAMQSYVQSNIGGSFFALSGQQMDLVEKTSVGATVEYAIEHPTTFFTSSDVDWLIDVHSDLWDTNKTIYDPCPPGWRVPDNAYVDLAWTDVPLYRLSSSVYGWGAYFKLAGNIDSGASWYTHDSSWYPNNGYMGRNGVLYMVGQFCLYWACNTVSDVSCGMEMSQTTEGDPTIKVYQDGKVRVEGHSVRCIAE